MQHSKYIQSVAARRLAQYVLCDGELINDGDWMTQSCAMGIMGREAGYSGRTITWDEIMNSEREIVPAKPAFGDRPAIEIAVPGVYQFS